MKKNIERHPRESSISSGLAEKTLEHHRSREGVSSREEVISGQMEIAGSFEQTIPLNGQALNSITYWRRLNVIKTLIVNGTKVKEFSLYFDNIRNPYLFGRKFEEKLMKITSAKQKSISIFTDLKQRKSPFSSRPNSQSFLSDPLPGKRPSTNNFKSRLTDYVC